MTVEKWIEEDIDGTMKSSRRSEEVLKMERGSAQDGARKCSRWSEEVFKMERR